MPAVSEKQRKMMAIAEHEPSKLYARNRGVLKMTKAQLSEFASTSMKPAADRSRHRTTRTTRT